MNQKLNKLINQFNTKNTFLVVSGYPIKQKGKTLKYEGMAWYTKQTLKAIAKEKGDRFVVLIEKNKHDKQFYLKANKKILILPVFDKKHPSLFPAILTWLLKFSKIKNVYIHSEFHIQGGIKNMALLLPFLALIRLAGKNLTFFAHNVIEKFDNLAPHFNLKINSLKLKIFNFGLNFYYQTLGFLVDRIVVLDKTTEIRIKKFINSKKIVLAPIWVNNKKNKISKNEARKKLGLPINKKIILYFGFITWYKGADWLVKQFKQFKNKNIQLVLAGGQAYSLKDKNYYRNYYQALLNEVKTSQNIQITGFVKDKDIAAYFKAADLVIFPYRGLIGGSGALSIALSFKKPFVLSNKMQPYFENNNFKQTLHKTGLNYKDLTFYLNKKSFNSLLNKLSNKNYLKSLKKFSASLAEKRRVDNNIEEYYNNIYQNKNYHKGLTNLFNAKFQPAYKKSF